MVKLKCVVGDFSEEIKCYRELQIMIIFKIIIGFGILALLLIQVLKDKAIANLVGAIISCINAGLIFYAAFTQLLPMMELPSEQQSMRTLILPYTALLFVFLPIILGSMKKNNLTFKEFLKDFFKGL